MKQPTSPKFGIAPHDITAFRLNAGNLHVYIHQKGSVIKVVAKHVVYEENSARNLMLTTQYSSNITSIILTEYGWLDATDAAKLTPIKAPGCSRAKAAVLTRDSTWKSLLSFTGFVLEYDKDQFNRGNVLKTVNFDCGDEITVIDDVVKCEDGLFGERSIVVMLNDEKLVLPIRFIGNFDVITKGKEKTYWLLSDKTGVALKPKRFKSLWRVKQSVTVISGNNNIDDLYNGPIIPFDDWIAVEYSAETENELQRVKLNTWWLCKKLSEK